MYVHIKTYPQMLIEALIIIVQGNKKIKKKERKNK
jgi:hypothetical protein